MATVLVRYPKVVAAELRQSLAQPLRDQVEIKNGNVPLAPLYIRQERPVQPNLFGHYDLSPSPPLPQSTNTVA
jgi:hypothetical protein